VPEGRGGFNEEKYKALLEELEITIKDFKEFGINNSTFRLDSEFFRKEYLKLYKSLYRKPCDKLEVLTKWVTQGPNPVFQEEDGIPCLTGRNINNGRVSYENADNLSEEEYINWKRFQIKHGDTLITLKGKGSIGKIGYVTDGRKAIFSRNIGIIRPHKINTGYVNAFILSKYGAKIIARGETGGTGQSTLAISYLKNIDVPRIEIEEKIGALVEMSEQVLIDSQSQYEQAELLLLETLGLKDFELSTEPVNVKGFKESFLSTGRLDAEYYQKKYEEVIVHITDQNHDNLANLVQIKKSIEPGSDVYSEEGLPFLRVSDFNKFGITEPDKKLSDTFCKENKELLKKLKPKKETILFSKDGSVGTAYMLRKDEDLITSGAILHLTVKDTSQIIPEYLTLALNSKLVQMQAERDAGGSIILHWRISEIENVVVPIIDYTKQEKIAAFVEESFRLKNQSEQLLETAKRAVEIAIEQDEEAAIQYIEMKKLK